MEVKISTKEKFHVLGIKETELPAIMADSLQNVCYKFLNMDVKNLAVNIEEVKKIDKIAAETFLTIQEKFYENNSSFVICCVNDNLKNELDEWELLDVMNITPTESEAGDIIQMEEIEREIMNDEL